MKLCFQRLILIHIFLLTSASAALALPYVKAVSSQRAGHYALEQGTDGCPISVDWSAQSTPAQGPAFTLNPKAILGTFPTENFSHINKRSRLTMEGANRVYTTVEEKDNYIRKQEVHVYGRGASRLTLTQEDTLIFSDDTQFVWEHSQNGKGFSCLYSK